MLEQNNDARHSGAQTEIRKATENDIPAVCKMITARMIGTVETSYHLDGISDKEKLFHQMITAQIEDIYRIGEIWIAGEYQGVLAGFYKSNVKLFHSIQSAVALNRKLGKNIDAADLKQLSANMKKMAGTQNARWRKQACGNTNYYYIQLVAIDSAMKGRGVFRQLIEPVLARLERENIPALIDTHDKDNVPIYEHFGFELVKEHRARSGAPIAQYSMIKRQQ